MINVLMEFYKYLIPKNLLKIFITSILSMGFITHLKFLKFLKFLGNIIEI